MFLSSPLNIRIAITVAFAALSAYFATPSVKALAESLNALDLPGDKRKIHRRAVPRMGGIAIFLALIAALLAFSRINAPLAGVVKGAAVIVLMGAMDDVLELRAPLKLSVQIIAALIAWRSGVRIEVLSWPLAAEGARFVYVGALSMPLTVLWITACTNALNLIDGLDGLAAGVAAISSASMLAVAALVSEAEIAILLAALTGACLGFLPYNRSPAAIFMGDVGSQLLGYLLSAASLLGMFKAHALITFFVPLLALALPLADTVFAFLRRVANGRDPFTADRGHLHHRLLDMGLDQRQAVAVLYGVSAAAGMLAVLSAGGRHALGAVCGAAIMLAISAAFALIRKKLLLSRRARD